MICNKCPMREQDAKKKNSECNFCLYCILPLIVPITWILLILSVLWIISLLTGISFLKIIFGLIVISFVLVGSAIWNY